MAELSDRWFYTKGADLPIYPVKWYEYDANGNRVLAQLGTGWTFELHLCPEGTSTATLSKSAGITGADVAPNVSVIWGTDELDIPVGVYDVRLKAIRTSDGHDMWFRENNWPQIEITPAVTPAV